MSLIIANEEFEQEDLYSINLVDSWVDKKITLLETSIKWWEKRLYMWSSNEKELDDFFDIKKIKSFFILKKDLIEYLEKAKSEYFNPIQKYKNEADLKQIWEEKFIIINNLKSEKLYINFRKNYDSQNRYWLIINDWKDYFKLLNQICLPRVSQLFFMKLKNINDNNYYIYVKPFFDIWFDDSNITALIEKESKSIENNKSIGEKKKEQVINARKWQWKYRQLLLEECPFCPITKIWDDRLLIASHIKPWAKSDIDEKIDPKNGFMLTPTYDLLFDKGFISFTNDKKIIISPWLSKNTCWKLNISSNMKYDMLPIEWREYYLDYHRKEIFKS